MEYQLCPRCHRHGRLLETPLPYAQADYYRCDVCGEVWSHSKPSAAEKPRMLSVRDW
jgi:hypothetical protein